MTRYWLAGAAALVLTTSVAVAQTPPFDAANAPQPNMSTNGPAGTYDVKKVRRTVDSDGNTTDTTQTFDKSQTYSSGNGALRAHTIIRSSGPTTTEAPSSSIPQETTK